MAADEAADISSASSVVLATIIANYEKNIERNRVRFRKQFLKITNQLRRNAKKREALLFFYFRAFGNRLFTDGFGFKKVKTLGIFGRKRLLFGKRTVFGLKTFECLGELSISCVTRYLVIFCVKTQPSEKLYLSKKDLQFAYGIWPLEKISVL